MAYSSDTRSFNKIFLGSNEYGKDILLAELAKSVTWPQQNFPVCLLAPAVCARQPPNGFTYRPPVYNVG